MSSKDSDLWSKLDPDLKNDLLRCFIRHKRLDLLKWCVNSQHINPTHEIFMFALSCAGNGRSQCLDYLLEINVGTYEECYQKYPSCLRCGNGGFDERSCTCSREIRRATGRFCYDYTDEERRWQREQATEDAFRRQAD